MHDRGAEQADRIESEALAKLERLFPAAVAPVLKRHRATLEKLDKLEREGAWGRARVLLRKSGIVNDLAKALAAAGKKAAALIREETSRVKEAALDE